MNRAQLAAVILAAAAAVLIAVHIHDQKPDNGPPPVGPDLRGVFTGRADAHEHAATFGAICHSLADLIEYDGRQASPIIQTGAQLDDVRQSVRQQRMKNFSFVGNYPRLDAVLVDHFSRAVGTSGERLDDQRRAAWVDAFRSIGGSALYAAGLASHVDTTADAACVLAYAAMRRE